jgi:hypothetical protein
MFTAPRDGSLPEDLACRCCSLVCPQEEYNDYHEGDTSEEIVMDALPVATQSPSLCQMMRKIQSR